MSERVRFFDLMPDEWASVCGAWGWPRYRAAQVAQWVYEKGIDDPAAMTNLAKAVRDELAAKVEFSTGKIVREQRSGDGTIKLLIEWPAPPSAPIAVDGADSITAPPPTGATAETVMIPDGDRRTACVSSQVGCPVGCRFCASGIAGVKGNLRPGQIAEQIFLLNRAMAAQKLRITNIVFMGMGEPLANYAAVVKAIRIIHEPTHFNIGGRRITVSTVGVPAKMRALAGEQLPLNLAISLHAPTEELRKQLIPWAEHFSVDDILEAARFYFDQTGREVTLEYILLSKVNDQIEHARQLAKLTKTLRANVNLIRYNEVAELPFKRPLAADVVAFQDTLRRSGVNAHVRKSRGRDIDAACGQLRRKEEREKATPGLVALTIAGTSPAAIAADSDFGETP